MFIKTWLKKLILSKSADEDVRRREFILNILLVFSITCFLVLNVIRIVDALSNPNDSGMPLGFTLAILAIFLFLFWLSKKGWSKTAGSLFIILYALPMFYSFLIWGADLPAALLLAILVIIMSGVLLGERWVLISTVIVAAFSIIVTYLQSHELIAVANYWRLEKTQLADAIAYAVLFMVISAVAWLFSREIKKALRRARQSEDELRQERDSLEIKVEERTRQIKQMEAEKINQLYRLAEFGRLSSGIFHDLVNPLTAVSLNLEQIGGGQAERAGGATAIADTKTCLNRALLATRKMEGLVAGIKRQIQRDSQPVDFSVNEEIRQTLDILSYKARRANVVLVFEANSEKRLHGDPVKFGQIISNLAANAIDASTSETEKTVLIDLGEEGRKIKIAVSDQGSGIAPETLEKIFEPFFSTKKESGGLGLGLSSTKHIVEKDFNGRIEVTSEPGRGATFRVWLPKK